MKKLGRLFSAALCAAVIGTMLPSALGAQSNTAKGEGPISQEGSEKKWAAKLGEGAMTPQTLYQGSLYAASGSTLYKIDTKNGSYDSAELEDEVSDTKDALTAADGKVFVPISGGRIQAFDADSLDALWISEEREDDVNTAITYEDGMIYAGTKSGYIGMTSKDDSTESKNETKTVIWNTDVSSGSDVYASDKAVIFAGADGELYSVDAENAENKLDTKKLDSPVSSSLTEQDNVLYFTSDNGTLYRVTMQSDGKFDEMKYYALGAKASAPTVANGRIYAGVKGETEESDCVAVLSYDDTDGISKEYSVKTEGFAGAAPLVSTNGDSSQVYFTTEDEKGVLYTFEDTSDTSSAEAESVYTPADGMSGAGGFPVSMDESGNIYYKTSNGNIIAVQREQDDVSAEPKLTRISGARKVNDTSKASVKLNASKDGNVYYMLTKSSESNTPDVYADGQSQKIKAGSDSIAITGLDNNKTTVWLGLMTEDGKQSEIKSTTLEQVVSADITVTPKSASLKVKSGNTTIDPSESGKKDDGIYTYQLIVGNSYKLSASKDGYETASETITAKASKTSYNLTLKSRNSKLSYLSVSSSLTNQTADFTVSPSFQPSVTEYTAKTDADPSTVYLWLRAASGSADCEVYGKSGVDKNSMNSSRKIKGESYGGYQRYAVKLKTGASSASLTVKVKSDSGNTGTYTVKIKKMDKTAPVIKNVTSKTKRTGASSATIVISSTEKAQGYLKVANIGVVPTNIISEGSKFNIKKGETTLNINGLASIARNIYIVAQDEAGNTSAKLKISIPAYAAPSYKPASSSNRTTTTTPVTRPFNPSNSSSSTSTNTVTSTTPSSPSTNSSTVSSDTTNTITSTNDGTVTDSTTDYGTVIDGTTDYGTDYTSVPDDGMNTSDESLSVNDVSAPADSTDVGSAGAVPDNSVISSGIPSWATLLIIIALCAAGLGAYVYFTKRKADGKTNKRKKKPDTEKNTEKNTDKNDK